VLLIDQTAGDMSLQYGNMTPQRFQEMVQAALVENPKAQILVKTHPDVLAGKRKGCIAKFTDNRVHWIATPASPQALLSQVDKVYVGTSLLGFEALMAGCEVVCFGGPFYAGWGLTDDRSQLPRRTKARSLEQVFAAAYILYSRYVSPIDGQPTQIETIIDHLARQRQGFERNAGHFVCVGFRWWKRPLIRPFLSAPGNRVDFVSDADQAAAKLTLDHRTRYVVWGRKETPAIDALARRTKSKVWRMEDGFIRSVGLGSDFTPPASLVLDEAGMYFDPTQPSDLENILQTTNFSDAERTRAQLLRHSVVSTQISKYNVGDTASFTVDASPDQRVVLVPGQVEDDASIRLGCVDIATNTDLLAAARRCCPDAFVIYKPHPDVVSGNRKGRIDAHKRNELADMVVEDVSIHRCLEVVDEVHTMTSLTGFEALLCGKRVVVYGLPFYAGWGLTTDSHKCERRTRTLSLEELVAGVLIRYPRYLHPQTGAFTTPEVIIEYLSTQREQSSQIGLKTPWLMRQLRKLWMAFKSSRKTR